MLQRLVVTRNGVGVGDVRALMTYSQWKSKVGVIIGVISSTKWQPEESKRVHFFRFRLRLCRLWSSENKIVVVGSRSKRTNQSQGSESSIVINLFLRFSFRLRQSGVHWIISDGVISGMGVLLPTALDWFLLDRIALRSIIGTLRYTTARCYYGYFGRDRLSWQRCFTRQSQMIKILLYDNGMSRSLRVFTKMNTFKATRDYSTFMRNRLD